MFKKKSSQASPDSFVGLIPACMNIKGDITFNSIVDTVRIEGCVIGNIGPGCQLYIAGSAIITGNIKANSVVVADGALITGNLEANTIVLKNKARVNGNITYQELSIEVGVQVDGTLLLRNDQESNTLQE